MKKIISVILILIITISLAACSTPGSNINDNRNPNTPSTNGNLGSSGDGAYEGEYDADGKRSGYGVWLYHNYRYEGHWKNDLPNGEGILYVSLATQPNIVYDVFEGNWVDGLAHGSITLNAVMPPYDNTSFFIFDVNMGTPLEERIIAIDDEYETRRDISGKTFGVPPFANVPTDPSLLPINPDGSTPTYTPPINDDEVSLVVAKGFEEREIIFRLTVPELHKLMEIDISSDIQIMFGNGLQVSVFLIEEETNYNDREDFNSSHYGNIFRDTSGEDRYVRGYFDGNQIIISAYIPDNKSYDWNTLDNFDVYIQSLKSSIGEVTHETYSFHKSDIGVHIHEILPDMYSLREYGVHYDAETISLKAKNNGDNTLTFTFKDTSVKQNYYYPWEYWQLELASLMRYFCTVDGKLSYDPRDEEVAITSNFQFVRDIGSGISKWVYENPWNTNIVNMEQAFFGIDSFSSSIYPDGIKLTIDENGLTAVWTTNFLPGYSLDDIVVFAIILSNDVFGDSVYFTNPEYMWTMIYFEVEDVME